MELLLLEYHLKDEMDDVAQDARVVADLLELFEELIEIRLAHTWKRTDDGSGGDEDLRLDDQHGCPAVVFYLGEGVTEY